MNGDENDFEFVYDQTDIDETFCSLTMTRKCKMSEKYKYHAGDADDKTQTHARMRKRWVEHSKQVFEADIPQLNPTHHVSVDVDVPPETEQNLRNTYIVERVKLHPTVPHNISGVEGGICFCTIGRENQLLLVEELKKLGVPDSWVHIWKESSME